MVGDDALIATAPKSLVAEFLEKFDESMDVPEQLIDQIAPIDSALLDPR